MFSRSVIATFAGMAVASAGVQMTLPVVQRPLPLTPRRARRLRNPPLANLSRHHPDYGMTPAQHAAAKAAR